MHRNFRFFAGRMPEAACAVGVGSPAASDRKSVV